MGYRTYIGYMPKKEYNKIKSLTKEQLIEFYKIERTEFEIEDGYIGKNVFNFGEALYEFGKYTDFEPPKKSMKTFFKNKELNKYFTDEHDFNIVTKEFLEYIIESYKKRVVNYYNDMMNPFFQKTENRYRDNPSDFLNSIQTEYNYPNDKHMFDFSKITDDQQNALFKIIEHIRAMRLEWVHLPPINLAENSTITRSWKFEYGIFELVRIYNFFDWKKNVMIYYGY